MHHLNFLCFLFVCRVVASATMHAKFCCLVVVGVLVVLVVFYIASEYGRIGRAIRVDEIVLAPPLCIYVRVMFLGLAACCTRVLHTCIVIYIYIN